MKRFLRHAACVAAILLLIICPVKALAANLTYDPSVVEPQETSPRGTEQSSIFNIAQNEKYWYIYLKVVDGDTVPSSSHYDGSKGDYLGVENVKVTLSGTGLTDADIVRFKGDDISGIQETDHRTDESGSIKFRLPKAKVGSAGYPVKVELKAPPELGFNEFIGNSGAGYETIPLTGKQTGSDTDPKQLVLEPIHLDVRFEGGDRGNLFEQDRVTPYTGFASVRWGQTLAQNNKMPVVTPVSEDWAHVGWRIEETSAYDNDPNWTPEPGWDKGDEVSVKALEDHPIKCNFTLKALYKRAYLVKYRAGDYGYLKGGLQHPGDPPGEFSERVIEGEKPSHVPTPVPMTEREYRFVKWRFDKLFSYDSIDPASITINGDTNFLAVFDVRKHQPVIITTPSTELNPTAPTSESSAAVPVIGGVGGGPGGGKGGGYGGGAEVPASEETQLTEPGETLPQSPPEETEPESSGTVPASPASGQTGSETSSRTWNWLILLCCLLTLAAGALRIMDIRRTIKHFADPQEGEKEKEKVRAGGPKPLVTEAILGIICLILWGYFYANRGGRWDLMALILWGVILAVMAVLLLRAERSLRHGAEKVKD